MYFFLFWGPSGEPVFSICGPYLVCLIYCLFHVLSLSCHILVLIFSLYCPWLIWGLCVVQPCVVYVWFKFSSMTCNWGEVKSKRSGLWPCYPIMSKSWMSVLHKIKVHHFIITGVRFVLRIYHWCEWLKLIRSIPSTAFLYCMISSCRTFVVQSSGLHCDVWNFAPSISGFRNLHLNDF